MSTIAQELEALGPVFQRIRLEVARQQNRALREADMTHPEFEKREDYWAEEMADAKRALTGGYTAPLLLPAPKQTRIRKKAE